MSLRNSVSGIASLALATLFAGSAFAQDSVKIGLILPMTGQQASTGKQIDAGVELYMQQHGATVAGKKIEVILKDDGAVPDNTKRLAQELIVNDKVNVIATYPMGVVKDSHNAEAAKAWLQFVTSKDGQKTLRKFGFLPP